MFRSHRPLSRSALCCLSTCRPLSPRPPRIPAALPAYPRPIPQRERLPLPRVTSHLSPITKSFTFRTYEKQPPNPFRIRTSKTRDLKLFGMNTYEKIGGGPPLPTLEFYNSLLRTSAPTRHAGALASPILSCISAHFPSHMGVGVRAHFQPQVPLRILASSPASRFEFRISHPLFHGPLLTPPCVTLLDRC